MVAVPLRAQSNGQSLTLEEYHTELLTAVAELEAASEAEADPLVAELHARFEGFTTVELPSGEEVSIRPILEGLPLAGDEEIPPNEAEGRPPLRELALARLRGAVAQIDASATDDTAARLAILEDILARPEFNTPLSLWDRFLRWLENLFSEWLPDSTTNTGSGWLALLIRLVPWLVTILIVAAVIWLLSYWLQRLLRTFVADARIIAPVTGDDMPSTAAEARQQARTAAQSGHYRDAVRRLYLAALLQLSEHELITYERSLTNREVLVRVPDNSPIRPHLEPVVATFDQVWYGMREPDQATFTAYEQEIDALSAVAARAAAIPERQGGA
jgi:hypothetical protein